MSYSPTSTFDPAGAAAAAQTGAASDAAAVYQPVSTLDANVLYEPTTRIPRGPQPSAILTEFQASHGFTATGGTFTTNDTSDFVRGTQAAKLVTPGDGTTYYVSGSVTAADSTGKVPRVTAKIDNPATLNSVVIDICTDTTWANGWSWTMQGTTGGSNYFTAGDWVTQSLSFHDAVKLGTGPRSGLAAVRFRIRDIGSSSAAGVHLQGVEFIADGTATFPNGVVSITFDDCYQDALDLGKTELDKYGYPASVFVIADRVGLSGRMTMAGLRNLQDTNGWELASHAYADAIHGLTPTGITAAQLDADSRAMKAFAVLNGFRAADLYAYPKGQYGVTTDAVSTTSILRKYFSIGITTVNKTKETYPASDAFRVRRLSSVSSFSGAYSPATVTGTGGDLDLCRANGSWLLLAFHEIVTSAPASATQILQSDYQAIIDGINSRGIAVMPVGEVLRFASTTATAAATIDTTDLPKRSGTAASTGSGPLAAPWDHVHPRSWWAPEDHGLITWTMDPATCSSGSQLATAAGTLNFARVHVPIASSVTNLWMFATATATLTSGQCFAGLYTSAGALIGSTADQSTAWATSGAKQMALTGGPFALTPGDYLVGWFANGSVQPTFLRGVSQSASNLNLSSASARFGTTSATGATTAMPSTIGTLSGASNAWLVALS